MMKKQHGRSGLIVGRRSAVDECEKNDRQAYHFYNDDAILGRMQHCKNYFDIVKTAAHWPVSSFVFVFEYNVINQHCRASLWKKDIHWPFPFWPMQISVFWKRYSQQHSDLTMPTAFILITKLVRKLYS